MFFDFRLFFLILLSSFNFNLTNALPTVISKTNPLQHQLLSPSRKLNANNVLGRSNNQPTSSQLNSSPINNENANKLIESLNSSTFSTDDVQVTLTNDKATETNLTKNEKSVINKESENKNNENIQNIINNPANQFLSNQPIIQVDTFNSPVSETESDFQCTSCLSLSNFLNSATALKCCNNGYSECCGDVRYNNFNNLPVNYNQNNLGPLNMLNNNNENEQLLNSPTNNENYGTKKKSGTVINKDKNQDLNTKESVTSNKVTSVNSNQNSHVLEENPNLVNSYTNNQYPNLTPFDSFSRKTSQPNKNYITKSGTAVNLNLGNTNANYLAFKKGQEQPFINNIYEQQLNNANWQRINNRNPNLENSNSGLTNSFNSFISHIPFIGFNPIPVVFKVSSSSNQQNNQIPANHAVVQDTHSSQQINNAYNSVIAIRPQSQNAQLINPNQVNQQTNQQLNQNINQQLNPGFVSSFLSRPMSLYQRIGGYFSRPNNNNKVLHYANNQILPIDLNEFLNEQNLLNLYNSQLASNNQPSMPLESLNYINPLLLSSIPYLSSENLKALKNAKSSKRS